MEKYTGSLLGLAIGDALGATLEFCRPGTFEPIQEIVGGGVHDLEPGEWTDDTSMALCLAESLLHAGGFDPHDQMMRYVKWYREGYMSSKDHCFDIGNATREALHTFEKNGEPFSGSRDPWSAGNGSIMRLAPVPLYYEQDPILALEMCARSSLTTHAAKAAVDACKYLGGLIIGAVRGVSKDELLSEFYSPVPGYWSTERLAPELSPVAKGSYKKKGASQVKGSGYVVESLEAALWAFHHGSTFEEGLLLAVNLGDDADTTGAVYGQIAGAYYGRSGLPERMIHVIKQREFIESVAERLWRQKYTLT
ncbi:ADP-ribosylglycohydrolase family protein [Brevibacillus brevis]|uniref:ADP-ribosylglycohydrolase family protein n=1 Tax=Brevibacillus brevis TaxID=1393 RepID=A0ABY9T7J0_BREBE|nr:ADP-ribosylglycohydrolase family protein [Brevibacillus brevis]WNC16059.1 ADP-ribosylglycohydrolase family protein [Brevibacillus brevis]